MGKGSRQALAPVLNQHKAGHVGTANHGKQSMMAGLHIRTALNAQHAQHSQDFTPLAKQ